MALLDPRMSAGAIVITQTMADMGDFAGVVYFAAPESGYIKEVHVVRDAAGGAGASVLTITTAAGAVAPTMTLLTAGAAGDVDSFEFSKNDTNNVIAAGEGFQIDSDGNFAGTPAGYITVVMEAY